MFAVPDYIIETNFRSKKERNNYIKYLIDITDVYPEERFDKDLLLTMAGIRDPHIHPKWSNRHVLSAPNNIYPIHVDKIKTVFENIISKHGNIERWLWIKPPTINPHIATPFINRIRNESGDIISYRNGINRGNTNFHIIDVNSKVMHTRKYIREVIYLIEVLKIPALDLPLYIGRNYAEETQKILEQRIKGYY